MASATLATYATTANAVAGANVSGSVAQANYANTANSVAGANVTGTVANATYATSASSATTAGTVTTAAQPNITSVGILTVVNTSGAVSATGNITGSYILGNGSQLTGLPATYNDSNVTSLLAAFGSNTISTTGNITAGYFIGNGSTLTSLTGANVTGTVANATYATSAGSATTATTAGTVTTAAQPNITSVGTLTGLAVSGNINVGGSNTILQSSGNILTQGIQANTIGANYSITAGTTISAGGNITGSYLFGNGSQLTGLPATYSNANVNTLLAAWGSNTLSTTGTINAGNITGGNILTGGAISATGNITGGNIITGGGISMTGSSQAASYSASGNVTGGNILTGGIISSTGRATHGAVTYANTDGTNGQVLTTYGNGITYFSTVSGGGGGGANIANGTSNVNIATSNGNITMGVNGTGVVIIDTGNIYTTGIQGPNAASSVQFTNYKDTVYALGTTGGTITPNAANGAIQTLTANANITISAFGGTPQAGQQITLIITQDGTGNRVLTSTMKFAGAYKTLSTTAGAVDIMSVFYDGTNYWASLNIGYA